MAASRISDNNENEETSASSSASFLLDKLPYKILLSIAKFTNPSDLFALSQLSQQFNEFVLIPGVINTIRCHYFLLQSDKFYEQIVAPRGNLIRELIVDDLITDGQVRRLLALCPNLLKFELRNMSMLCEVQKATQDEILSALADYCKQVEQVKLDYRLGSDTPELQKFANKCQQLTSLSDRTGPAMISNKILAIIAARKWPKFAKVYCNLNAADMTILSSLPITHLKVTGCQQRTKLEKLLNGLPQLQHFEVEDFDNLDLIVKHLSTACTQLTSVTLGHIATKTLEILVKSCPMIEFAHLKIERTVDESILKTVGQGWKNLKSLKFLAFIDIITKNILSSFVQCSQLHSVDFNFINKTDAILADNIKRLPTQLKHLRLSCRSAGDLTTQAISAHLVNITSAEYHIGNLTSAACHHLFNMKHLTHLSVFMSQFMNDEDIAKLAKSSCASTLQSLVLLFCKNLTDKCFSSFTKLRKLRKLIVQGMINGTDAAIQDLTQSDEFCKRLQHLEIVASRFTDAVFKFLAKFSDLRTCRLTNFIKITEAGVQEFFNDTSSPYLMDAKFSKHLTSPVCPSNDFIKSRLNGMGQVIDSYYKTEFNN